MTRDWWLFGNLPHTIFEAAAVLASLVVSLYLCTGVLQLQDIREQCRWVDVPKAGGGVRREARGGRGVWREGEMTMVVDFDDLGC